MQPQVPNCVPTSPWKPFSCFPHSASSSENIPSGLKHLRVRADVENSLTPSLQCADVCCRVWQWAIHCLEGHCPGEPGPEADLEQVGNKPLRCRMGYVTQSVLASPDRGNLDVWPESRSQADSSSDFYLLPSKESWGAGRTMASTEVHGREFPCDLWLFMSCLIHDSPSCGRSQKGTFVSSPWSPYHQCLSAGR